MFTWEAQISGSEADVGSGYPGRERDLLDLVPSVPVSQSHFEGSENGFALLVVSNYRPHRSDPHTRPKEAAEAPAYFTEKLWDSKKPRLSWPWLVVTSPCDVRIDILEPDGTPIDTFIFETVPPAYYRFSPSHAYLPKRACILRLTHAGTMINEIQFDSGFYLYN